MKRPPISTFVLSVLFASISAISVFAQKERTIDVGKTGKFHLGSSVRIGDKVLKSGMYRLEIVAEGSDRFVVIREVAMNKFGRSMGSEKLGDEVARLKSVVEAVEREHRTTKILTRLNAGEREAVEIWFRNEKVKYVLPKTALL